MSTPHRGAAAIRPERSDDHDRVRTVVLAAFADQPEVARLIDALRRSPVFVPDLSLVATVDRAVVGHVMLTRAELVDQDDTRHAVLVLSPLSVSPPQQRQGIGAAFVGGALEAAEAMGEQIIVLQGSPRYYPRFGVCDSRTLGISMDLPDRGHLTPGWRTRRRRTSARPVVDSSSPSPSSTSPERHQLSIRGWPVRRPGRERARPRRPWRP